MGTWAVLEHHLELLLHDLGDEGELLVCQRLRRVVEQLDVRQVVAVRDHAAPRAHLVAEIRDLVQVVLTDGIELILQAVVPLGERLQVSSDRPHVLVPAEPRCDHFQFVQRGGDGVHRGHRVELAFGRQHRRSDVHDPRGLLQQHRQRSEHGADEVALLLALEVVISRLEAPLGPDGYRLDRHAISSRGLHAPHHLAHRHLESPEAAADGVAAASGLSAGRRPGVLDGRAALGPEAHPRRLLRRARTPAVVRHAADGEGLRRMSSDRRGARHIGGVRVLQRGAAILLPAQSHRPEPIHAAGFAHDKTAGRMWVHDGGFEL
mmetsp:Transcript_3503/g.10031  ORF Transcript_3503/g.10031 Transcript_3503/m.10031 type:complete len:320 (+) Transcript_3503:1192-2151(+)